MAAVNLQTKRCGTAIAASLLPALTGTHARQASRWGGIASVIGHGVAVVMVSLWTCTGRGAEPRDLYSDTWVCTDGAGRQLPGAAECGPPKPGKTVGIFYWTWHESGRPGPHDITKLIAGAKDGRIQWPIQDPGCYHWGEPELGYYTGTDPYVINRHASMLADAGVDVVFFDTTNPPFTWKPQYEALCREFSRLRSLGEHTPAIAFVCPFGDPRPVLDQLWRDLYAPGHWKDLWFAWQRKPLVLADIGFVTDERMKEFFTWRKPMPDYWHGPSGPDQWGWLEVFPQHVFRNGKGEPEQMTVGVAINALPGTPGPAPMSHRRGAMGRGWHGGSNDRSPDAVSLGRCFDEQWRRALEVSPPFVFVTGWNEWVAGRIDPWSQYTGDMCYFPGGLFVDEYNQEFSRDCEPMKGGHGDNFYYQLASWVRRYKGVRAVPHATGARTIRLGADDWRDVGPEYRDTAGDTLHRDHVGYGGIRYTNDTGRNDIVRSKASFDAQTLFFMVESAQPLTPCTDANWMLLFLDTDRNSRTGWSGYDVRVNGRIVPPRATSVEVWKDGAWREAGTGEFVVGGTRLEIAVPRALAGMADTSQVAFDFHWADNVRNRDDPAEFALNGDSAPNRRFNYRFTAQAWHHPLSPGNGGLWRQRVEVVVTNPTDRAMAGAPATVRVGRGDGETDLVATEAQGVRVCDARGVEMLYDLATPDRRSLRHGPIPAGAELTLPVECPPHAQVPYYVYFDNPSAWPVPDFLTGTGRLHNGGLEEGSGEAPDGWQHDANDDQHRTSWVEEGPRSGRRCLKTQVSAGAEPTWIATRQSNLQVVGGAKYVMTAWVKGEDVDGYAGWYIHMGNEQTPMLISPMLTAGSGTFGWKQVRAEITAPPEADRADLGTVLRGTGTAWFDDVTLECSDGQAQLPARAGKAERLAVQEVGADAAWWDDDPADDVTWQYRTPIQVINLTDRPLAGGLLAADLSPAMARLQGKVAPGALRLVDGAKLIPHHRLGGMLLFAGEVPPRTVKTFHVYLSIDPRGGRNHDPAADRSALPVQYAPNPALPGGGNRSAQSMALDEYAALLADPANLVKNASFETGDGLPESWLGGATAERPAGTEMGLVDDGLLGKRCARMHVPHGTPMAWTGWRQDVPVQPRKTYLYAAWLKCADLQGGLQLHAHLRTAAGELVSGSAMTGTGPALSGTRDWTFLSGTFTMSPDCALFQLHLTMQATGTAWHDGVVVAEVTPVQAGLPKGRADTTASALAAWPVNALVKVFRNDVPPRDIPAAHLTCARNELEPLQLAVRSPTDLANVEIQVVGPTGPNGATLGEPQIGVVGYVPIDHPTNYYSNRTPAYYRKAPAGASGSDGWSGWWPDPVLPQAKMDLAPQQTQPVWVTVRVPEGAPPGDYRGAVRLAAGGRTLAEVPFSVRVWDFTLPRRSHLKAIFDCRQQGAMWRIPGLTPDQGRRAFWQFMADHRVCPDTVRPEPTLSYKDGKVAADFTAFAQAAEYYFDELQFAHAYTPWHFYLFGWGHLPGEKFGEQPYAGQYPFAGADRSQLRPEYKRAYQACLKAYWDHVKAKGWADRIVLYISDEPYDAEAPIRAQMKALCAMIHEVDPAIPIYCSTWHHQPEWDGSLDVWGIGHFGVVPVAKMRELVADGARLWWTTDGMICTDTPYCAIERLLPHYCFKYGAEAYEFWGIDWLTHNPYEYGWHAFLPHDFGPGKEKEWVRYPNGDGFLAYPPGPLKLDHAVSSVRLEQVREGVEDYEYLYRLRELVEQGRASGRDVAAGEKALAMARGLVDSPCEIGRYSTRILPDPDKVLQVKIAVAQAIEQLQR